MTLIVFLVAYVLAFQSATLYWGRLLAGIPSDEQIKEELRIAGKSDAEAEGYLVGNSFANRGLQDALTPPVLIRVAWFAHLSLVIGVASGFYQFGLAVGAATLFAVIFFLALKPEWLLPKRESEHFRSMILRSVLDRHAQYERARDSFRAGAMIDLLRRFGVPVEELLTDRTKISQSS